MKITNDMLDDYITQAIESRDKLINSIYNCDKRTYQYRMMLREYYLLQGEIQAYAHIKALLSINVKRVVEGEDR